MADDTPHGTEIDKAIDVAYEAGWNASLTELERRLESMRGEIPNDRLLNVIATMKRREYNNGQG